MIFHDLKRAIEQAGVRLLVRGADHAGDPNLSCPVLDRTTAAAAGNRERRHW
jgi:hypothetical protein